MPEKLPITVYSPEPILRHPAAVLKALGRDLKAGRHLAWRLFVRDFSAQYRQTILGYLWAFLPPVIGALTFIFLRAQKVVQIDNVGIPYPAFAFMGTLLWQVFAEAMQNPPQALIAARVMLVKLNFPREAIFIAGLCMIFVNFLIRLALLVLVMIWYHIVPGWGIFLFPIAIGALMACGFAVGLCLSPIGALYGDIGRTLPVLASFWMLLTPVIYPSRTGGLVGILTRWNPVAPLIITAREALTGQAFSMLPEFFAVSILALLVIVAGLILFRMAIPHVIARIGSG